MKRFVVVCCALCGCLVWTACGGSKTKTIVMTGATTSTTQGMPSCNSRLTAGLGTITQGNCSADGTLLHWVYKAEELHLKTLGAKIDGVTATPTVSNGAGFTTRAKGTYLIIKLAVTNDTPMPQTFDGTDASGTLLLANGDYYKEIHSAESTNDLDTFIANNDEILPHQSKTGDLIFDVPPATAKLVTSGQKGELFVGNFGEDIVHVLTGGDGMFVLGTTEGIA
jgi:Domain of unknown function (DUF4352)